MSEKEINYEVLGFVGTVADSERGEGDVFATRSDDSVSGEAIAQDLTRRTGEPFEYLGEMGQDGSIKSFGFSNWKGCTWIPEGPRPNWIDPKKSN